MRRRVGLDFVFFCGGGFFLALFGVVAVILTLLPCTLCVITSYWLLYWFEYVGSRLLSNFDLRLSKLHRKANARYCERDII